VFRWFKRIMERWSSTSVAMANTSSDILCWSYRIFTLD
jgi:hypothetical protein